MSPESIPIFLADDRPERMEEKKFFLERGGHKVVLTAANIDEALQAMNQFIEKGVVVAGLDVNFDSRDKTNKDGVLINQAIAEKFPHILRVGMASDSWPEGSQIDLDTANIPLQGLARAIDALPMPKK
ncbi:MAG: hypothetical protein WAV51_00400 [Microgenomates group bacterium]